MVTKHPNLSTCNCRNCQHVRKQQQRAMHATMVASMRMTAVDDAVVEMWNETLKSFPCLFLPTSVKVSHKTVGPKHDPYGVTRIDVTRRGVVHSYISCSMGGDSYERDGEVVCEPYLDCKPPRCYVAYDTLTEATGGTPDQWMKWQGCIESQYSHEDGYNKLFF